MCTHSKSRNSEKGISLIEVAIALIVIGLMLIPLLKLYDLERTKRLRDTNIQKVETLNKAILNFARLNGRLPVPARLDRVESDDDYGKSATTANTCAALNAAGLKCKTSGYDTDDSGAVADEIVVGFVPYKDLNLSIDDAIDVYGSKITYIASRQLLVPGSLPGANAQGAIRVLNQLNANYDGGPDLRVTTPSGRLIGALYMVISHGPDRRGAYLKSETTVEPCLGGGWDALNCNPPTLAAMPSLAHYRALQAYQSDNTTVLITAPADYSFTREGSAEHFDDTVRFVTTSADAFWTLNQNASREDIFSRENTSSNIGIGVTQVGPSNNGNLAHRLYVNGNIATNSNVQTVRLCDKSTTLANACFAVRNITAGPATFDTDESVYCGANLPLLTVRARGDGTAQRLCADSRSVLGATDTAPFTPCTNGYDGFCGTTFHCKGAPPCP